MIDAIAATREDTLDEIAKRILCVTIAASRVTFPGNVLCLRKLALSVTRGATLHSTAGLIPAGTRSAIYVVKWVTSPRECRNSTAGPKDKCLNEPQARRHQYRSELEKLRVGFQLPATKTRSGRL